VLAWPLGNSSSSKENGEGLLPGPNDTNGVEFRIPAGVRDHVEEMLVTYNAQEPLSILGIRPHAHLAAVDIKLDIERAGSPAQCLVQDRWDFHWQRVYSYDAPIWDLPTIGPGDKLRVRCKFDNSMMNRRLGQELWERGLQPRDLFLGDETLDEMCMVELLYVRLPPGSRPQSATY
jgi:hypothetical protein